MISDQWKTGALVNLYVLDLLFEAEVSAGFAADAFAIRAGAFEGVEGKMAGREIAENLAGAGVAVGGLESEFSVIFFAGWHEEDARFRSAEP